MMSYRINHKGAPLDVFITPDLDTEELMLGTGIAYFRLGNRYYRFKLLLPESQKELEVLVNHVMYSEVYVVIAKEEFERVTA